MKISAALGSSRLSPLFSSLLLAVALFISSNIVKTDAVNLWEYQNSVGVSPAGRYGHDGGVFTENGEYFMFGGSTSATTVLNDTWIFRLLDSTWVELNPTVIPPGRSMMNVERIGAGYMVMIGGLTSDGSVLGDVWIFERSSMSWWQTHPPILNSTITTAPVARYGHTLVLAPSLITASTPASLEGDLILFGGTSASIVLGDVWVLRKGRTLYDLSWQFVQPSDDSLGAGHPRRSGHSSVVYQNSMYTFGGHDQSSELTDTIWVLTWADSQTTWSWTRLYTTGPSKRTNHRAVIVGTVMILHGGEDGGTANNGIVADTWSFDPLTKEWKELDNSQGKILYLSKHCLIAASSTYALTFGGLDNTLSPTSLTFTMLRQSLDATWSRLSPSPDPIVPRVGHVAEMTRNVSASTGQFNFFVIGGMVMDYAQGNVSLKMVGDLIRYDSSVPKWEAIPLTPRVAGIVPGNFAFAQSFQIGQWIVVHGGRTPGSGLWAVDTRGQTWEQLYPRASSGPTPRPVWKHGCDMNPTTFDVYCFGGETTDTVVESLNEVWFTNIDSIHPQAADGNLMASFDGQNAIVLVSLASKPITFTSGITMTVEAWFISEAITDNCMTLFTLLTFQNPILLCMDYDTGRFRVVGQDRTAASTLATSPRIDDGDWHHVALVIDTGSSTVGQLYVDGVLSITDLSRTFADLYISKSASFTQITIGGYLYGNLPYTIPVATSATTVGTKSISGDPYWTGSVDEFRVWSIARTRQQILDNMFLFSGQFDALQPGVEAVWNFDNVAISIFQIRDSSSHGRHAIAGDGFKFSVAPTFSNSFAPSNQTVFVDRNWYTSSWVKVWPVAPTDYTDPAPTPRHSCATVLNGQIFYLFGGFAYANVSGKPPSTSNEVWTFDIIQTSWTLLSAMSYPAAGLSALTYGNVILILGGYNSTAAQYTRYFNISMIDLSTQEISSLSATDNPLNQALGISLPLAHHTFNLFSGNLYVFGGTANTMVSAAFFGLSFSATTLLSSLTPISGTSTLMSARSLCVMKGDITGRYMYGLGGISSFASQTITADSILAFTPASVWKYDLWETRWQSFDFPNAPLGVAGHASIYYDTLNELIVHGGYRLQPDGSVIVSNETNLFSMRTNTMSLPVQPPIVRVSTNPFENGKFAMMMPLCDTYSTGVSCGVTTLGGANSDTEPNLAINSAGLWMTVWHTEVSGFGSDTDIFYSVSTDGGATWSEQLPLNRDATRDTAEDTFPRIGSAGSDGNFRVVWQSKGRLSSDGSTDIYTAEWPFDNPYVFCGLPDDLSDYMSDPGQRSLLLPTATSKASTTLSWSRHGSEIFAVWREIGTGDVLKASVSTDEGNSWTSRYTLQDSSNAKNPSATFVQSTFVVGREFSPSTGVTKVSTSIFPIVSPYLFCTNSMDHTQLAGADVDISGLISVDLIAGEGGLIAVAAATTSHNIDVSLSLNAGLSWKAPVRLDTSRCAGNSVSADGQNSTMVIMWTCSRTNEIQLRTTQNGGTLWSDIGNVSTSTPSNADLFVKIIDFYRMFTIWTTYNGLDRTAVFSSSHDIGVSWSPATLVYNSGDALTDDHHPRFAHDGNMTMVAVWSTKIFSKAVKNGTFSSGRRFTDCHGSSCRLEIQNSVRNWGTVCSGSNWGTPGSASTEATVICGQLGFGGVGRWTYENQSSAINLPDSAFLEGFTCSGTETDFLACAHSEVGRITSTSCDSHHRDIRITCDACSTKMRLSTTNPQMVYCDYSYSAGGTDYEVVSAVSTNDGVSWTAPVYINYNWRNDTGDDINPSIVFATNTFLVVWETSEPWWGSGSDFDLVSSRSTDGFSWTAPSLVNTNAATDLATDNDYSSDLVLGSNSVFVTWLSDTSLGGSLGTDVDSLITESRDGGLTWTESLTPNSQATVNVASDGDDNFPLAVYVPGHGVAAGFLSGTTKMYQMQMWNRSISQIRARISDYDACSIKMFGVQRVISDSNNPRNLQITTVDNVNIVAVWDTGYNVMVGRSIDVGGTWTTGNLSITTTFDPWRVTSLGLKDRQPRLAAMNSTVVVVFHHVDLMNKCGLTGTAASKMKLGPCSGDYCLALIKTSDGRWGTVCDDTWDRNSQDVSDANSKVMCAAVKLSVRSSTPYKKNFGSSSYPMVLGKVNCSGSESDFDSCPRGEYDSTGCSTSSTVAVSCCGPVTGTLGIGTDSDIFYSRSSDGGITWSPAKLLSNAFQADNAHDFVPDVATQIVTVNGALQKHWMIVWESKGLAGGAYGYDWDIFFSLSTDDGVTWSTPTPVLSNAASDTSDDRDPRVIGVAGRWTVTYTTTEDTLGGTSGPDTDPAVVESIDNGATWTQPATLIADTMVDSESTMSILPLATDTGNLIFALESSKSDLSIVRHFFPISTRRSLTFWDSSLCIVNAWSPPVPLVYGDRAPRVNPLYDGYPRVMGSTAGTYVIVWQSNNALETGGVRPYSPQNTGGDYDIFFVRSGDSGKTWSAPAALNASAFSTDTGDDKKAFVRPDQLGGWVCIWETTSNFRTLTTGDLDVYSSYSTDDGRTWSYPTPVNSNALNDTNSDYTAIIGYSAGVWFAAWEVYVPSIPDFGIFFATSNDGGKTWSKMAAIDGSAKTSYQQRPRVALSGSTWLVTYESSSVTYEIRTLNSGETWSSAVALGNTGSKFSSKNAAASVTNGVFYVLFVTCEDTCGVGLVRTLPTNAPVICPNVANSTGFVPNSLEQRFHMNLHVAHGGDIDTFLMLWRGDFPLDSNGLAVPRRTIVATFTKTGLAGFAPASTKQFDATIRNDGIFPGDNYYNSYAAFCGDGTWLVVLINDTSKFASAPTRQNVFSIGRETSSGSILFSAPQALHSLDVANAYEEAPNAFATSTLWVIVATLRSSSSPRVRLTHSSDQGVTWSALYSPPAYPVLKDSYDPKIISDGNGHWVLAYTSTSVGGDEDIMVQHRPHRDAFSFCDPSADPTFTSINISQPYGGARNFSLVAVNDLRVVGLFESNQDAFSGRQKPRPEIWMLASNDGGATWPEKSILTNTAIGEATPSLAVVNSAQQLVASWIAFTSSVADSTRVSLLKNGDLALSHRPYVNPMFFCSSEMSQIDGPDLTDLVSSSLSIAAQCDVLVSAWSSIYDAVDGTQYAYSRNYFSFSVNGGSTWILGGRASPAPAATTTATLLCSKESDPTIVLGISGGGSTNSRGNNCSSPAFFYSAYAWVTPLCSSDLRVHVGITSFDNKNYAFSVGTDAETLAAIQNTTRLTADGSVHLTPFNETFVDPLPSFTSVRRPALALLMAGAYATSGAQRLVVAYEVEGGWGVDVDLAFSVRDGSGSWTTPALLNSQGASDNSTLADGSVALATDGSDVVVAAWHRTTSSASSLRSIYFSRSDDGGSTWSDQSLLTSSSSFWDDSYPSLTTDDSGMLWMVVWQSTSNQRSSGSDRDIMFSVSTDAGSSWSTAAFLNSNYASDIGDDTEARVTYTGGRFVCVWSSTDQLEGRVNPNNNVFVAEYSFNTSSWGVVKALNSDATAFETASAIGPPLIVQANPTRTVVAYPQAVLKVLSWPTALTARCQGGLVDAWSSPAIFSDGDLVNPSTTASKSGWAVTASVSVSNLDIAIRRSVVSSTGGLRSTLSWLEASLSAAAAPRTIPRAASSGSTVMVVYHRQGLGLTASPTNPCGIFLARSADGGVTWDPPVRLSTTVIPARKSYLVCEYDFNPDIATDGAGNWIVAWETVLNSTFSIDVDTTYIRSSDNGLTWSEQNTIEERSVLDRGDTLSPRLSYSSRSGSWICVWRMSGSARGNSGIDMDVGFSESVDGGLTWSNSGVLNPTASSDTLLSNEAPPVPVATSVGFVVVTECCSNGAQSSASTISIFRWTAPVSSIVATSLSSSTCMRIGWSPPHLLNSGGTHDALASFDRQVDMAFNGSTLVAVWETANPTSYGDIGVDGDIISAYSTNWGATWTFGAPVNSWAFTDSGEDRNPKISFMNGLQSYFVNWISDSGDFLGADTDVLSARSFTGFDGSWSNNIIFNQDAEIDTCFESDPALFEVPSKTTNGSAIRGFWSCTKLNSLVSTGYQEVDVYQKTPQSSVPGGGKVGDCTTYWFEAPVVMSTSTVSAGTPSVAISATTTEVHSIWSELSADGYCRLLHQTGDGVTMATTDPLVIDKALPSELGGSCDGFQVKSVTLGTKTMAIYRKAENIWTSLCSAFSATFFWTTPVAITTVGRESKPSLAAFDNKWVAVWQTSSDYLGQPCCNSEVLSLGGDPDIMYSISKDQGQTWTNPQPVSTTFRTDGTSIDASVSICVDGNGVFLAVWETNVRYVGTIDKGTDYDIIYAVYDSRASTPSWSTIAVLNGNAGSDSSSDISAKCASPSPGNWVTVWQSVSTIQGWLLGDWNLLLSTSSSKTAGGWTSLIPLNGNAEIYKGDDLSPSITADSLGRLITVWSCPTFSSWLIQYGASVRVFAAASLDGGRTWSPPFIVDYDANTESRYPVVTNITTGFMATWISGADGSNVRSAKIARYEPVIRNSAGLFYYADKVVESVNLAFTAFGSTVSLKPSWNLQSTGTYVALLGSKTVDLYLNMAGHSTIVAFGQWDEAPQFSYQLTFATARAIPFNRTRAAVARLDLTTMTSTDFTLLVHGGFDATGAQLTNLAAFRRSISTWVEVVCYDPVSLLPIATPALKDSWMQRYLSTVQGVLAGTDANGKIDVWILDSLRDWSSNRFGLHGLGAVRCTQKIPTNAAPVSFSGHSFALYGSNVIVLGGVGTSGSLTALDDIFAYNLVTSTWRTLPRIGGSSGLTQISATLFGSSSGIFLLNSGSYANEDSVDTVRDQRAYRFQFLDLTSAVPSLCVASGTGTVSALATQSSYVTITALNPFGQAASRRKLTLDLTGAAILKGILSSTPTTGTYVLTYKTQVPGIYTINIKVAGVHISNSPITIQAQAGETEIKTSTASGDISTSVAGATSSITIIARDSLGNRGSGGDYVRVTLQEVSKKGALPTAAKVTDRYDGSYDVSYTLTASGKYTIDISINSKPIPNSPFTVVMNSGTPDPTASSASGTGVAPTQNSGAGSEILVQLKDALGNNATIGGDDVLLKVYSKSNSSRRAQTEATSVLTNTVDNGDGSYRLFYYPFEEGLFQFVILVNGQIMQGSPFDITVKPVFTSYTGYPRENVVLICVIIAGGIGLIGFSILCFPCRFLWNRVKKRKRVAAFNRFKIETAEFTKNLSEEERRKIFTNSLGQTKTYEVKYLPSAIEAGMTIAEGYKELISFVAFIMLFTLITLMQAPPAKYFETNTSLRNTVGDTTGLQYFDDFWTFLDKLITSLFQDRGYNGVLLPPADQGFINKYNKLVGGIQLVQYRGKNAACGGGSYSLFYGDCHSSEIDMNSFGSSGVSFNYSATVGAHVEFFSVAQGKTGAQARAAILKQYLWLDKNTRQVVVKFASFNGEQNLFNFVSISFTHSYGGIFAGINKVEIQSIRMEPYLDTSDYVLGAFELLYLYIFAAQIRDEATELITCVATGRARVYFTDVWNIVDWTNLALAMAYVTFRVWFLMYVYTNEIKIPTQKYEDALETASSLTSAQQSMAAIFLMVSMMRLFKYFQFQDRMKIINLTLQKAFMDLFHFLILFFLLFSVYVALGYMIMGPHDINYSSFGGSMQKMSEIILGNFDFAPIGQLQPLIGSLFFWIYIFLVVFVLLNVFLAIIIDAYADAKQASIGARSIVKDAAFGIRWASVSRPTNQARARLGVHPFVAATMYFEQLGVGIVSKKSLQEFFISRAGMSKSAVDKEFSILNEVLSIKNQSGDVLVGELLELSWNEIDTQRTGQLTPEMFHVFLDRLPIRIPPTVIDHVPRSKTGTIKLRKFVPVFANTLRNMFNHNTSRIRSDSDATGILDRMIERKLNLEPTEDEFVGDTKQIEPLEPVALVSDIPFEQYIVPIHESPISNGPPPVAFAQVPAPAKITPRGRPSSGGLFSSTFQSLKSMIGEKRESEHSKADSSPPPSPIDHTVTASFLPSSIDAVLRGMGNPSQNRIELQLNRPQSPPRNAAPAPAPAPALNYIPPPPVKQRIQDEEMDAPFEDTNSSDDTYTHSAHGGAGGKRFVEL